MRFGFCHFFKWRDKNIHVRRHVSGCSPDRWVSVCPLALRDVRVRGATFFLHVQPKAFVKKQSRVGMLLGEELPDCPSFSNCAVSVRVQVWDVCLSVRLSVCVTGCVFAAVSVRLSGLLHPDRAGTLPALCHMISLEAAGVKLI